MSSHPHRPSQHRRSRRMARHTFAIGAAVVAAGSMAGCAGVSGLTVVDGPGLVWSVGVSDPRFAGDERCDGDPSVDIAVMTADLPTSGYGITLFADATEDDAQRIAGCLRDALTSGTITITRPSSE